MTPPVVVFDFDNTITRGDLLDELIEAFSSDEAWRIYEADWVAGRISARECLQRQVEGMRVSRGPLLARAAATIVDSAFADIVAWARQHSAPLFIVSDSFAPIIEHVLATHHLTDIPIFANALSFDGDRLHPSFPYYDAAFPRSANAKARHLEPYVGRSIVYAGDGRSDFDAAFRADVVFAKDSLAAELRRIGRAFHPFDTLDPLLAYLRRLSDVASFGAESG